MRKGGRTDPAQNLTFARPHDSLPAPTDVKRHQKVKSFISVACEAHRGKATGLDVDIELFLQFPDQGRLRGFARLKLAAGKFPQPFHGLAGWTLGQQDPPVAIDQGDRRHQDKRQRGRGEEARSTAVTAVNVDVAVREIAGPHHGLAAPQAQIYRDMD